MLNWGVLAFKRGMCAWVWRRENNCRVGGMWRWQWWKWRRVFFFLPGGTQLQLPGRAFILYDHQYANTDTRLWEWPDKCSRRMWRWEREQWRWMFFILYGRRRLRLWWWNSNNLHPENFWELGIGSEIQQCPGHLRHSADSCCLHIQLGWWDEAVIQIWVFRQCFANVSLLHAETFQEVGLWLYIFVCLGGA